MIYLNAPHVYFSTFFLVFLTGSTEPASERHGQMQAFINQGTHLRVALAIQVRYYRRAAPRSMIFSYRRSQFKAWAEKLLDCHKRGLNH